jgi:cytochrome c oxidase assembly protein subunit 15
MNLSENAMTVQFNHRVAAYLLVAAVLWHAWRVMRHGTEGPVAISAAALAAGTVAQAALGIWTLLAHVPLGLGLAHQAGAAAVFGLAVWHLHAVQRA